MAREDRMRQLPSRLEDRTQAGRDGDPAAYLGTEPIIESARGVLRTEADVRRLVLEAAEDDVDDAMLQHIASRQATHRLRRVVVASGDGRNFLQPLEELHRAGVRCVVLSFAEVAGYAQESPLIEFVDLEDVPGAFQVSLGRTRLTALPPDGGWFRPTRPMRALLEDAVALEHPHPAEADDSPHPQPPEVGEVGRVPVPQAQRVRSA